MDSSKYIIFETKVAIGCKVDSEKEYYIKLNSYKSNDE